MPALKGVEYLDPGYGVTARDLEGCCKRQAVHVEVGDVVLVNLGNAHFWHDEARYLNAPGVTADASRWLCDRKVVAVGADNICWDLTDSFDEQLKCNLPGHLLLLARCGVFIMENLNLAPLAAAGQSRFLFIAIPLKLVGATGSPIRPLAMIPKQAL